MKLILFPVFVSTVDNDRCYRFTGEDFINKRKEQSTRISREILLDGTGRAFDTMFVERLWRMVEHGDIRIRFSRNGS